MYLASVGAGPGVQNSSSNFRGFRAKKIAEITRKSAFCSVFWRSTFSNIRPTSPDASGHHFRSRPENQQGQPKEFGTHTAMSQKRSISPSASSQAMSASSKRRKRREGVIEFSSRLPNPGTRSQPQATARTWIFEKKHPTRAKSTHHQTATRTTTKLKGSEICPEAEIDPDGHTTPTDAADEGEWEDVVVQVDKPQRKQRNDSVSKVTSYT
jgi:hypothetical protein